MNLVCVFHLQYMVVLPSKVVNNTIMHTKICTMPWLRNMQVRELLTLRWRSFSGYHREYFAVYFASKGCHYRINGCLLPFGTYLTQDAKLKIIDASFTLMLRMGRWSCYYIFWQWNLPKCLLCITTKKSLENYRTYKTTYLCRLVASDAKNGAVTVLLSLLPLKLPIRLVCITTTKSLVNYCTYKTTNCWCSVDAHAKNGAVTVLLPVLLINAANTWVMHNNDQVTGELPYLQDHKLLTLRWRSC